MKIAWICLMMTGSFASFAIEAPRMSATCVACHGAKGVSANPLWPNIAGQKPEYIVKELTDFKEGRRVDPLMSAIAKLLSEQDVKELAQYYSTLHD